MKPDTPSDGNLTAARGFRRRLDSILGIPGRRWLLLVPLHLVAFLVLYLSAFYLLYNVILDASQEAATVALQHEAEELGLIALTGDENEGHDFEQYIETHRSLNLILFDAEGHLIAGDQSRAESTRTAVSEFIRDGRQSEAWHEPLKDHFEIGILERIVTGTQCIDCHEEGQFLGVVSQSLDLTQQIGILHGALRTSLGLLILAWALAVMLLSVFVNRSVRRSVARLEADLHAARSGQGTAEPETSNLVLDPVSANLHKSVRTFLQQQRQRDLEMTSRLAHSDQLASMGQLAAGLAHEIKNPLAGIQSALEILRDDTKEERNSALCTEMLDEMQRVNQTLQLLLSSVRPSPPRLATTDIRKMLEEVRRLTEPAMRQKKIAYKLEIAPGRLECKIDEAKIRQVLINLIGNAAEALDTGGEITARAGTLEEESGIIITVEDNGPGIPEDVRAKIFDPFFTTKFTGTGLGLAISKSLVDQHGGSLKVQSEVGSGDGGASGTTFFVILPAKPPTESTSDAPQAEETSD